MRDPDRHQYDEPYAYYNALLAGEKPAFYPDHPEEGFYVLKNGFGDRLPVAIYYDDSEFIVAVNGTPAPEADHKRTWRMCGTTALPYDDYQTRMATGSWRGEQPAAIGDNNPPSAIEDVLPQTADMSAEWLAKTGELQSKKQADEAANRINALSELILKARKTHKAEKEPHLRAGQAVDDKYNPKIRAAEGIVAKLRAAITHFDIKLRAKEDAQRAEEEEKARVTRIAEAALDAARAGARGKEIVQAVKDAAAVTPEQEPPPAAAPKRYGTTGVGRGVKIKIAYQAVIQDQDAVYQQVRTEPEVIEVLQKLAQRWIDAGHEMRGVDKQETSKATR